MSRGRGIVQEPDQQNFTYNLIDESECRKEEQCEKVWFEVVIIG